MSLGGSAQIVHPSDEEHDGDDSGAEDDAELLGGCQAMPPETHVGAMVQAKHDTQS